MDRKDWDKLESLFQSALAQKPETREKFLNQECEQKSPLRAEVAHLLSLHERAEVAFFEKPFWADESSGPAPALGFPEGFRLGRYEIVRWLGVGGMGEVYLSWDAQLRRNVAVKVFFRNSANSSRGVSHLLQEARLASALNHANILTVYEVGETEGHTFIATEFVEGVTLRERLGRGPLPTDEALSIIAQVASALDAAHKRGILHRDIKPGNLMLRPDNCVKVLDFGLAKLIRATTTDSVEITKTLPGQIVGSVSYMSPEQLLGEELDFRSDLWSLGAVLFEMITGAQPFRGATANQIAASILALDVVEVPESISPKVRRLLSKTIVRNRDQRYTSAHQFLEDLRVDESRGATSTKPRRRVKLRGLQAIAAVAIVFTVAVLVLLWRESPWIEKSSNLMGGRMLPLTNTGNIGVAAISPDGKYLAFTVRSGGQESLWLRQIATSSDQIRIPSQAISYQGVNFSPDGNHIYYVAEQTAGAGSLWRIPCIGGNARLLVSDVDGSIAISPDGKLIAFIRGDPSRANSAVMLATSEGDSVRELTARQGEDHFVEGALAWSPDGESIIAAAWDTVRDRHRIALIGTHIQTKRHWQINTGGLASIYEVCWRPRDLLLIATDERWVNPQIFRLSPDTGETTPVTSDLNWYSNLSASSNGALAVVQRRRTSAVWISAAKDGWRPHRLTPATGEYYGVSWIGTNKLITEANIGGHPESWAVNADSGQAERFNDNFGEQRYPRVCGSGQFIVFSSIRTGNWKIWRSDIDGKNTRPLTSGTSTDGGPSCTPDGKWVIFNSDRSGLTTLWRVPTSGGSPEQLTTEVSYYPEVSPDGKLIASIFTDTETREESFAVIPITGGRPLWRAKGLSTAFPFGWGPDRDRLIFVRHVGDGENLFSVQIGTSSEYQLTHFDDQQIFSFSWAAEPRRLALVRGLMTTDVVMLPAVTKLSKGE